MSTLIVSYTFPSGQRLEICQGDITRETVDAIVNAANAQLMHGGGVAAAIARQGGAEIQRASTEWVRQHGAVSHDAPAYTPAGKLACRYVIHAVGPVWGAGDEDHKLAQAIAGSLHRASELGLVSLAFPAISTGIFGFPKERAAQIFFRTLQEYFSTQTNVSLKLVRLVLFDEATLAAFLEIYRGLGW